MITHKDKLQNQIKKIQSLINDISESNLEEKLSIGGGVIVDLTCNSINTNSINTNSLSTDTLTTNNITNSDNITTKNLTVSNKLTSNYDLTCYNIYSTNINNVNGITSNYLETVSGIFSDNCVINELICNTLNLVQYSILPIKCNIEIRDYPNPSKLLYNVYGLGLLYEKKISFMYCSFITSSSYTGYTKPAVMLNDTSNQNLYIRVTYLTYTKYNHSNSRMESKKLKYIGGIIYDESYSSMIYQYDSSMGSPYHPYLLRQNDDKGVFNRAGVCVEFKYAEIA